MSRPYPPPIEDYTPTARMCDWLVEIYTSTSRNSVGTLTIRSMLADHAIERVKAAMTRVHDWEPGKYRLCARPAGKREWIERPWKKWHSDSLTEAREWLKR